MESIINYRRLKEEAPGWEELELEYRSHPKTNRSDISQAIATLIAIALTTFGVMMIVRVFGSNFLQPQGILLCTFISMFVAFFIIARDKKAVRLAILTFVSGPFISFFIGAVYYTAKTPGLMGILSFVALVACIWLIDRMVLHYGTWLLANPAIPRAIRLIRLDWYKHRWDPSEIKNAPAAENAPPDIQKIRAAELKRIRGYRRGFLIVAALYAILPHLPKALFPDALVFFVPPIFALFRVWHTCPSRGFFAALQTSVLTFTSWLTYGIQECSAPGVLQSPAGTLKRRTVITALVFCLAALVITPYVGYFGFPHSIIGGRSMWRSEFDESMYQPFSTTTLFIKLAAPEGLFQDPLSPEERANYNQATTWTYRTNEQERLLAQMEERITRANMNMFDTLETRLPQAWTFIALDAIARGNTKCLYPLCLWVFVCVVFPFLMLWTLLSAIGVGLLTHTRLAVEVPNAPECREPADSPTTLWEKYVARLKASKQEREAQHLWLGAHRTDDYPILLDREILSEHAYIVGDSGSGKTALGISPLLTQLIRAKDAAIVILDLKGDNALFQTVRDEASKAGLTFKFFTNEMSKPTFTFNPFLQANPEHISLNQICETMLEALNLNHGEGYGRSYFSRVARRWLSATLKSNPEVGSFEELYELTQKSENFRDKERQDAFELIAVVESLASFQQLNIIPRADNNAKAVTENAIHMPDVIEQRQVIYFWLPAAVEAASVREIAKLALYSLLNSAYWHVRTHGKRAQTYLVIDEFQRIASENFKIILEQARSMGVGAILANQTFADLKTNDTDLRPTVQTNTRFKQVFSATDLQQQLAIMTASGEKIRLKYSWSRSSSGGSSVSASENTVPRIERNDVIEVSDDPFGSIVHISRGSGYSQFSGYMVPTRVGYAISKATYDRHLTAPWPQASEATITVTRPPLEMDAFPNAERRLEVGRVLLETKSTNAAKASDESVQVAPSPASDLASRLEALAQAQFQNIEKLRAPQKPSKKKTPE